MNNAVICFVATPRLAYDRGVPVAFVIVTIVVGVLAASAIFGWSAIILWKHVDRSDRDARYRRRWLLIYGSLYTLNTAAVLADVATGRKPLQSLLGLPIALLIVWYFFRQARRVKIPPDERTKI
jgi:hypothetical protein